MSKSDKTVTKTGVSFVELLQLVFIVLKLTKVINWSWIWVLAPTWITTLIILIVIGVVVWLFNH